MLLANDRYFSAGGRLFGASTPTPLKSVAMTLHGGSARRRPIVIAIQDDAIGSAGVVVEVSIRATKHAWALAR